MYKEEIDIPDGVTLNLEQGGLFHAKGQKGEARRKLFHPRLNAKIEGNKIIFEIPKYTQSEKKMVLTYKSHLQNMFKGVSEGIVYKLKVCASHFPMNVSYNNQVFEVKNFIGEKKPRRLSIPQGVDVKVEGDEITLTGTDKELVGQAAASIETLTKRRGFDHRIFQDGIYITEKDGKGLR